MKGMLAGKRGRKGGNSGGYGALALLEGDGDGEGIVQTTCSPDQAIVMVPRPPPGFG